MANRDIVVIGASAGGVEALSKLVSDLPASLRASVFIVLHMSRQASHLTEILARGARLSVMQAKDGDPIVNGRVYVAVPDHHLLLEKRHIHLGRGPSENRHRPAINPLFRSAALAYGPRVIGVVLTGQLDDGTVGLWEIKRREGVAVVQDPGDALHSSMPASAMENVPVDHCVKLDELGALLTSLTEERLALESSLPRTEMRTENTQLTCPDCHGPLKRDHRGNLIEFRCRVGHAYSPESVLEAHADAEERTLWSAIETLEEGADLIEELKDSVPPSELNRAESQQKRALAKRIREMLEGGKQANSVNANENGKGAHGRRGKNRRPKAAQK